MVIRSLNNLHAKIYIFDDSKALVTSANATNAGMWRNLECGLSTDDRRVVRQLSKSLLSRFDEEERRRRMPKILNLRELEALYPQIEAIKVTIPERPQDISQNSGLQVGATFSIPDRKAFLSQFGGWRRLTVEGVLDMPGEHFTLTEFTSCANQGELSDFLLIRALSPSFGNNFKTFETGDMSCSWVLDATDALWNKDEALRYPVKPYVQVADCVRDSADSLTTTPEVVRTTVRNPLSMGVFFFPLFPVFNENYPPLFELKANERATQTGVTERISLMISGPTTSK